MRTVEIFWPTEKVSSSWKERLVKLPAAAAAAFDPDAFGLLAKLPARLSVDPSSKEARGMEDPPNAVAVVFARLQFRRRAELVRRPFLHVCCG